MQRFPILSYISAVTLLVAFTVAEGSGFAATPPAGNVTDARVASETPGDNWLVKGGGFAQQQFSPLTEINDKNVKSLGLAWIAEMDDPMGLAAEPLVVDGVIYISAPRSIVRAIDAANGKILVDLRPACAAGLFHRQFLGRASESRRRGVGGQDLCGDWRWAPRGHRCGQGY